MIKIYRFRVYPTKKQEDVLCNMLDLARFAYNKQLELKIQTHKVAGKNLSCFDLNNCLIGLKGANPFLLGLHSQVLQNVNQRIAFAFENFYGRVKKGEKPGFPRFKSKGRYDSVTYPQSGFSLGDKLRVSKIGDLSIVQHRAVKGKIKSLTIKRTPAQKWFASFSSEQEGKIVRKRELKIAGIDLGLCHFYADSRGNMADNPRCLRRSEQKLAKLQRKHSRKKTGGSNRQKSRLKVARTHEKIANQRQDFLHKQSRKLANTYPYICIENLSIKNMTKNHHLAKSIADASWHKFQQMLAYKVEETGGKLLRVDARGTSQYCICGNHVPKTLSTRTHKCNRCGIEIDRDIMSALVIEKLALSGTTAGSAESNAWKDERLLSSMNQESHASAI